MLTESRIKRLMIFLGETYHERNPLDYCGSCLACLELESLNRTFTTQADMMDLYQKIFEEKQWHKFTIFAKTRFSFNDYDKVYTNLETGFYSWLFCLSGDDYEKRCGMVDGFLEGGK